MHKRHRLPTTALTVAAATALAVLASTPALAGPAAGASPGPRAGGPAGYETIAGSGSSFEAIALNQWIYDAMQFGLTVDYNPDGTAEGQQQYINGHMIDFAGSDLPFRTTTDKLAGLGPQHVRWGFSYIPGAGTGIAFMYHISIGHHRYTHLRLSGHTLMEIFTGQITNWDNPQITHDTGTQLPSLPIIPVIRADGSGTTYYFTRWMAHQFPGQWNAFCDRVHPGITPPCGPTEFYPQFGHAQLENGSINVANFITSSQGQGAIGYDEYAYAVIAHYPVLALRNPAGDYVQPTPQHVTTALSAALINENPHSPDFLQENLTPLYTFTNPASYPLSYYSYLIVPRTGAKPRPPYFNLGAGRSLSAFLDYTLCPGQKQVSALGYAPLPANLVAGGLRQVRNIPGHGPVPTQCAPTHS
jgi:ABC-type phosphate transport system substrate-binding protein